MNGQDPVIGFYHCLKILKGIAPKKSQNHSHRYRYPEHSSPNEFAPICFQLSNNLLEADKVTSVQIATINISPITSKSLSDQLKVDQKQNRTTVQNWTYLFKHSLCDQNIGHYRFLRDVARPVFQLDLCQISRNIISRSWPDSMSVGAIFS